jgi:8-oxo-dGTP pyrophosphatase MutT (NUDIX family)
LDDKVQVLLITSRDTGRWIIPKGNIDVGLTPSLAAEREAYEEAGVEGTIGDALPLGFYTYFKKRVSRAPCPATVEVYLLRANRQLKKWPEKSERKLLWVSIEDAARLVEEPGVVPLLRRLMEIDETLVLPSEPLSEPLSADQ